MRSYLCYGEIVAKISEILSRNPDHIQRIARVLDRSSHPTSLYTICAQAGQVFNLLQDELDELVLDWPKATEC